MTAGLRQAPERAPDPSADPTNLTDRIDLPGLPGRPVDPLAQAWLDTVAANYSLFGPLITAGELTAGTLLFLGLFTRFGAALGIFLNLNYQWMKGWGNNAAFNDRGWLVCELVILLVGAIFMSTAYVQSVRGHVAIEAVAELLSPAANRFRVICADGAGVGRDVLCAQVGVVAVRVGGARGVE